MDVDEAKAECQRWLDYLKRQEEKSIALQRLAADRRAGRCDEKEMRRRMGQYQISNLGRVKSLSRPGVKKDRILKLRPDSKGYSRACLFNDGIRDDRKIHQLVAACFIPNPKNKPEINHKDGDKKNNHVLNLEWCTRSENQIHAYKLGLNYATYGTYNKNSKLSDKEIIAIRSANYKLITKKRLSKIYGVDRARS